MIGNGNIKIENVKIDQESKTFVLNLRCNDFVMYEDVKQFAESVKESIQAADLEFNFKCNCPYEDIIRNERGRKMLWHSMLEYVKEHHIGAWAVLNVAECVFFDDEIMIGVPEGSIPVLERMRVRESLVNYIDELWGRYISVEFSGTGAPVRKGGGKIRGIKDRSEKTPLYFSEAENAGGSADRKILSAVLGGEGGEVAVDNDGAPVYDEDSFAKVNFSMEEYERAQAERRAKAAANPQAKYNSDYQKVYGGGNGGGGAPRRAGGDTYMGKGSKKKRRLTPAEGEELRKDSNGGDIIIGDEIVAPITKMNAITMDSGIVAVKGRVFGFESKQIPSGSYVAMVDVTDGTYSISARFFFDEEDMDFVSSRFKAGKHLKLYGEIQYDKYIRDVTLRVRSAVEYKPEVRMDNAEVKRVELHLHTTLSAVDAITRPPALVKRLVDWGHTAVAITDHGVVQAYPDVFNAAKKLKSDIKIIYGMECYLTDQPGEVTKEEAKNIPSWHCILLVKDTVGLKNLYKLISKSNLNYFYKRPRVPRFELEAHREGLIVGSACSEGELYHALVRGEFEEKLLEMASFYDYLEIQPVENDMYLIREGVVSSLRELKECNKKIVELADKLGKMTVATCDVHFLDPEDAIYRAVMQTGQGYRDAEQQPPLYLRTTAEMLAEFDYLGDRAYEVVVENTNKIADMIERIRPVPDGFFPPVIEGSDEKLRESSYEKAKATYGDPIPEHILARLDRELNAIIDNGYSIMYITAKELVAESARNGYTVGSRGSVGSSLAAYMSGITEVNSLPPHYRCPDCFYQEFFFKQEYEAGCDMPDKDCPNCHKPLIKDGFDIPFETFLGFEGDKVPDIDLNFAPGDQSNAHKYTEVLFGKGYVFRAGTISGLAEKTAQGYVKKYLETTGRSASETEIKRLASGFEGVKKTTGQHPGGIMVIPRDKEIYDFTPIQHPAEAVDSDTITTHFDYHFLHDNILKLDILGHDGPAILKYLEDFTGISPLDVPLGEKKVMSLFSSPDALEMDPDELKIKIEVGTLGIPEFGTSFVKQMLLDTRPTTVSELIRISGLSHGTDVWLGNAQTLIQEGKCTLSEAICCRDDIMLYLIKMGLDKKLSFTIMESVRKGKGLKPEWEEEMRKWEVPEWYIESCKMIKYMFPKAHAVAYTMLSVRIAWYKVYYPVAYYATRFTIKLDEFDAMYMIHGVDKAYMRMEDLKRGEMSAKEEAQLTVYEQLMEMYARHVEFLPIDLYESHATMFVPENGKIRPPFAALAGLGVNAAKALMEARDDGNGPYESIEDVRIRSGANKAVIEILREEGVLEGLPEDDSLTLFDF